MKVMSGRENTLNINIKAKPLDVTRRREQMDRHTRRDMRHMGVGGQASIAYVEAFIGAALSARLQLEPDCSLADAVVLVEVRGVEPPRVGHWIDAPARSGAGVGPDVPRLFSVDLRHHFRVRVKTYGE